MADRLITNPAHERYYGKRNDACRNSALINLDAQAIGLLTIGCEAIV